LNTAHHRIDHLRTFTGIAGAAVCLALCAGAGAATPMEEKVFKTPMPHTQFGGGAQVQVDYARLQSELKLPELRQRLAAQPREVLAKCVADRQKRGMRVNPPAAYPSFDLPANTDTYVAANRRISYVHQYVYHLNIDDCSMVETETYMATLESSVGSCRFDLVTRSAEGECDLDAHRKAPALPKVPTPDAAGLQKRLAEMEADPRRAATAAQLRKLIGNAPQTSGQKKTVAGLACQVGRDAAGTSGCITASGLLLEGEVPEAGVSKAVQAMAGVKVSEAVFAPLSAGAKGGAK